MNAASYDDCALEYANYWRTKERTFVAGVESDDPATKLSAIRKAAGYFRIARNFPLNFDVERGYRRFEPVLEAFEEARAAEVSPARLVEVVSWFQRRLGDAYGGRKVLSAATKFLWLLHRDPVVIFDSQARVALKAPIAHYARYLELWHEGYERAKESIVASCTALGRDHVDSDTASTEWFHRRVFDIYLWRTGGPQGKVGGSGRVSGA